MLESFKGLFRGDTKNPRRRFFRLGVALYAAMAIVFALLLLKPQITTLLATGDTIKAEFASSYKMSVNDSTVKFAGITVGSVTKIEYTDHKTAIVTMKVDHDAIEKLGTAPTAHIEPRTVLGGRYAVEMKPGGGTGEFKGGMIPLARTTLPVELDTILEALPGETRKSLQGTVSKLDDTLAGDTKAQLRSLVKDLPSTLKPTGVVLTAAEGTNPGTDLPNLVTNLQSLAETLTENDGQLDDIVTTLHQTSTMLAAQRQPLAQTMADLPQTLTSTRSGLKGLSGTLDQLTETADNLEPSAPELATVLSKANPVLKQARPLLNDLVPTLQDAQPAVAQLVPVAKTGTGVLKDLKGPVLDRVNGPVMDMLNHTWHGTGYYKDSGGGTQAKHVFYQELAYMVTNIDRASSTQDAHGSLLGFQVGAGIGSITGLPFNLDNLLDLAHRTVGGNGE